jgi:transglutaminase-like putative cysteine protease
MLEAHQRSWLFTLDTAALLDGPQHYRTNDGQFLASRPVTAPLIYRAVSHVRIRQPGELSPVTRRRDTRLPEGRNPRTAELALQMRRNAGSDADFAAAVMRYFGSGGFQYTLTPPWLDYNSVDDLLFNTRRGFCGHFSSAFVTLMRAAGVPARVVTGYLGGSWNGIGEYFVVRQSDAHAWAEVWLDGAGWVRLDPTGMVAPARLQRGLNDLLPATRSAAGNLVAESGWLRGLRDAWDASGSWWRERVVNFNAGTQRDLLSWLGLGNIDYRGMALLLLAGATLWALVLLAFLRRRAHAHPDALGRIWQRYVALLQRRGLPIADHEGPEAIRHRAMRAWPEAGDAIERLTRGYEALRFGTPDPARWQGTLPDLRRQLRLVARRAVRR